MFGGGRNSEVRSTLRWREMDSNHRSPADISGRYPPTEWARLAITAYRTHQADRIVAEVNNGGDMVGATLRMVNPNVAFTAVRASRGKMVRAEPVAALYQQGRIHHIGTFPQLEDQMTNFTSDIDRAAAGYSPDRVDALVWAFSELLVKPMNGIMSCTAAGTQKPPRSAASHNLLKPCPAWLDGVVRGAEEEGLNHQVVSFKV